MEAIKEIKLSSINLSESAQPSNGNATLTKRSSVSQQDVTGLTFLFAQTKDRYIQQELPEGTQEMYLAEWEEMVLGHRLDAFRLALSTAIRGSRFFPPPDAIRTELEADAEDRRMRDSARRCMRQQDAWRRQWERERAEDIANGIPRGPKPSDSIAAELGAVPARRSPLAGWTAAELRAAADALERGENRAGSPSTASEGERGWDASPEVYGRDLGHAGRENGGSPEVVL